MSDDVDTIRQALLGLNTADGQLTLSAMAALAALGRVVAEREHAEAQRVLLEEALRRIAATPNFKSQPWSVEALQRVARAALVGDAPPPNTKPEADLGAPPARAEQGRTSGDSA